MKILILSCNTGGGHNSAALAMREYFDTVGAECEIRDALAFKSEVKSKIISQGHVLVYKKAPHLFGAGYRYLEQHPPKPGQTSVIYDSVKNDSEELYDFLSQNTFDVILCTHLFAAMIVTEMKKKFDFSVKTYLIVTDYTCYPGMNEITIDRIFIPHPLMLSEYEENGIPLEKITPTGIPVKASFYQRTSALDAKKALGLDESKRMVLIMCGSMGAGPIPELAESLIQKLPADTMLTVICGSNEKLYKKFQKMDLSERVRVVGFTDCVSLYMDASDVILTKPGGLSATESATKGIPMVLVDAVPGCETKNMDFFIQNGFALTANDPEGLSNAVMSLLFDHKKRENMLTLQKKSFSSYAAQTIGKVIVSEATYIHG